MSVLSFVLISLSRAVIDASFWYRSDSRSLSLVSLACDSVDYNSLASSSCPKSLASFFSM